MFERQRTGAVDVIRGGEPLNHQEVAALASLFDACVATGQPRIVLDLERVPLIDSAGLELLLDCQEKCAARGGALKLAAPTPLCRDILTVTDVLSRFQVYQDSLSAVRSFAL